MSNRTFKLRKDCDFCEKTFLIEKGNLSDDICPKCKNSDAYRTKLLSKEVNEALKKQNEQFENKAIQIKYKNTRLETW